MYSIIFLYSLLCVTALSANTTPPTEEPFTGKSNSGAKIALRCSNAKYINYANGKKQMECQSKYVSEGETFVMGHVAGHDQVSLKGFRSLYAQVQSDGNGHYTTDVWTNEAAVGPRSTFEKVEHKDQKVSFKCINNLFLNMNDDGKLSCVADQAGDAAKFAIEPVPT